ncbi:GNAT family N-acetyltransferase [Streptococcus didelphis]|uniref:GNAT family N-acetyltransferase n=1 Tax=Streptococcus didelphis TaxID=102886 RepID=A0ABY9LH15_9STRE|nr:GNAT family N-acetyltransferase [Streptococcus didelphis]WMB28114.1 GNAT family N-acetyltransferase [Streptococcus didelphis]
MDIWTKIAACSYIETERLILRPPSFKDAPSFFDISGNPEQVDFIFPSLMTKAESDYLLTHAFLKNPLGKWAIQVKSDQKMIGIISFDKMDSKLLSGELGYFLNKTFREKGYMTEALKTILYFSFREFQMKHITIITHAENRASQRVAEKSGFSFIREFKGSDRYTHKMRRYKEYQINIGDYNE